MLGHGAFVLHGATVSNVTVPADRIVPVGAVITTQAQADALLVKDAAFADFQRELLEVNEEFAESYPGLYAAKGFPAVSGVSVNPKTSWNPSVAPTIGPGGTIEELTRIVGDVRLGAGSEVGRRSSIRADEGTPIVIGDNASIEDRVTFHALKGTAIAIGKGLKTGNNIVFHGPLTVGDNLTIGEDAVLFRAVVGNNVTIGEGALVIGPAGDPPMTLKDGAVVPAGAIVSSQAQADAL